MNHSFIFTDHGLKRFNQRCSKVDKKLELKSLRSVKKKDVPNLSNSASYKKNKNKDKLHFFISKNDFYFVCEEKKQLDNTFALVIVTVLDHLSQFSEEQEMILEYHKRIENKKIQAEKEREQDELLLKRKIKADSSFKYFSTQTFSLLKYKDTVLSENYSNPCLRSLYIKIFNIQSAKFSNLKKVNIFHLSEGYLKLIKELNKLLSLSNFEILGKYKIAGRNNLDISGRNEVNQDFVFFREFIQEIINFYGLKLINSIYKHLKLKNNVQLDIIEFLFNHLTEHETYQLRQNDIVDYLVIMENKNIGVQQRSSCVLYKKDFVKKLKLFSLIKESTVLEDNVSKELDNVLEFYIFTISKMEEFGLDSFRPN